MTGTHDASRLTDPQFCINEAARLVIPVTEDNWDLVEEDAVELNILQAAIMHLIYLDTDKSELPQKVLEIVFTAYMMGRNAEERSSKPIPDAFRELIAGLNLSEWPELNK
jgi:hypothetical protein